MRMSLRDSGLGLISHSECFGEAAKGNYSTNEVVFWQSNVFRCLSVLAEVWVSAGTSRALWWTSLSDQLLQAFGIVFVQGEFLLLKSWPANVGRWL